MRQKPTIMYITEVNLMRVTFIATSAARLDDIPIIDGQIIAIVDQLGYYYDLNNTRYNITTEHVVEFVADLTSGTKIGTLNVDGTETEVFAPTPPSALSELTNDTGFITSTVQNLANYYLKSETYSQAEVNSLIGAISTISFILVETLPTTDIQTNVIYLVPKPNAATQNVKDEYVNLDGTSEGWELIGSTEIDLSEYAKTADLGDAAFKNSTTAIAQGSSDLITAGAVYDYVDQMVTQALNASY